MSTGSDGSLGVLTVRILRLGETPGCSELQGVRVNDSLQ
ncbi:hypothetical protein HCH_00874 [Hahella chejuensis KCTC 2396]|uniref:Uncharacterized protein n=1 Tax=Hahella chejuensis (strain KCTC 2396) TaxID=349521 RepID=Q2SNK8_HAHCH|nr:hypothetical protein HCH_00874 [Hahella chejuensis KCTC 2396]